MTKFTDLVKKYFYVTYKLDEDKPTIRIVLWKFGISINLFVV